MAITTLDGVVAGMRPPESYFKIGATMKAVGQHHSHWYSTGRPGAGAAPSAGINGAAVTAPLAGAIPHTDPGSGNSYLARFGATASVAGQFLLCDRLWANSGLNLTITTLQSITPATLPARDRDGTTNGVDVLAALEWSVVGGAGTPVVTLTYTDEAGNTGVTTTFTGVTTPNVGTFFIWPLAAGDLGVRAVTGYQQNATWTSGTAHIVLFRILAVLENTAANIGNAVDAVTGGMPRIYDGSVPFIVQIPTATTATNITGQYIETQG